MTTRRKAGTSVAVFALSCALAAAPVPALAEQVSGTQTFGNGQSGSITVTYQTVDAPHKATIRTEPAGGPAAPTTPAGLAGGSQGSSGGNGGPSGLLPKTSDEALRGQAALAAGAAGLLLLGCLLKRDNDDEGDADDAPQQ